MYCLYIRVAVSVALSCSSSQYRIFTKETIISARACQLMYDMYIRVVILGVLSRHSSIYRIFIYSFIVIGE